MNKVLKGTKMPPSEKFEKEWEKIEIENKNNYLFLIDSPGRYAYFMNKGLLKSSKENILLKEIKNQSFCFKIDQTESIQKVNCEN